ncbi:hypothetical protein T05_14362, partial [Trichinella murrelli]
LAAPSRGQKGLLLRPDLSAFARQLRARQDPNHDHIIGCRRGCRSAPEIASAPAASELPIGGSRRVDRGPADLGPIYMARKRAAKHTYTYTYPDLYQDVYLSILWYDSRTRRRVGCEQFGFEYEVLQYWLSVLPVFRRVELRSADEPSRSATEGRSSEGLVRT